MIIDYKKALIVFVFSLFTSYSAFAQWDQRPTTEYETAYEEDFTTWDETKFYNQWETLLPDAFTGFNSGPSKTADIESTLVFGAHGAKNLVVFLVDE